MSDETFEELAEQNKRRRAAEVEWERTHPTDPVFSQEPINWTLIGNFARKPHPAINREWVERAEKVAEEHGVPYLGEAAQEAQVSHHLLDMLRVPCPLPTVGGAGHPSDLDARVWRAVVGAHALIERLARISTWHSRETGPAGTVGDYCNECGHAWPCDTYRMAEGTYTEDDDLIGVGLDTLADEAS